MEETVAIVDPDMVMDDEDDFLNASNLMEDQDEFPEGKFWNIFMFSFEMQCNIGNMSMFSTENQSNILNIFVFSGEEPQSMDEKNLFPLLNVTKSEPKDEEEEEKFDQNLHSEEIIKDIIVGKLEDEKRKEMVRRMTSIHLSFKIAFLELIEIWSFFLYRSKM